MLYVKQQVNNKTNSARPTLVFLHGFLGDSHDWQVVVDRLPDYRCLMVDLPGHGKSVSQQVVSFEHTCRLICHSVTARIEPNTPVVIIGYSLGARLAMYGLSEKLFTALNVVGYLFEAGHFGLQHESEKTTRLANDMNWAARFRNEPVEQVLNAWYQQAVFRSLSAGQRAALVQKRAHNQGHAVADMLLATSLAKQPYFQKALRQSDIDVHYVCGEKDHKFFELAQQSGLSFTVIKQAGHNVHQEQPLPYAQLIQSLYSNSRSVYPNAPQVS